MYTKGCEKRALEKVIKEIEYEIPMNQWFGTIYSTKWLLSLLICSWLLQCTCNCAPCLFVYLIIHRKMMMGHRLFFFLCLSIKLQKKHTNTSYLHINASEEIKQQQKNRASFWPIQTDFMCCLFFSFVLSFLETQQKIKNCTHMRKCLVFNMHHTCKK